MEKIMEKESTKRSWPWKKKSNDKISAAPELGTSPNSSRLFDDQQKWDYQHQEVSIHAPQPSPPKEQARFLQDRHDHNRAAADEARSQWLQSEERAKLLSEKLATALSDITTKDNLVKQHVKVAEEAVTGWEKAEAEAVALKAQLDVALQQKLATEDRVAHLDGALKECMKQLRHVREEQEQRIHDTLVKKTREYDKLRVEMETKLAESSHVLAQTRSELLESRAEVTAISHALQERSRSIAEISEARGRAETDIKILQVRLETVEKENSQLKYEVHVLNKELEIRSQEREYERKAVDMASKQHLESVKKIAKLEAECNRLRLLVQKKLPGPAAIQRMRMEVEGLGKDPTEKRRRSLSRSSSNLDLTGGNDAMQENAQENSKPHTREAQMLAERVVAMDEEMKMLKEALSQRNGELQSARLMCAKTATRLSVVEEELNRSKQQNGPSKLVKSVNGPTPEVTTQCEGSETWSTDLDYKKIKGKFEATSVSDIRRDSQNFELMDDFAEMERLAMTQAFTESDIATQTVSQEVDSSGTTSKQVHYLEEALASKNQDLEVANKMCQGLKTKLTTVEKQLSALQVRNSANESSLINLQDQLDLMNEAQHEKSQTQTPMPSSKGLSGYSMKDIMLKKNGQDASEDVESSSSEGEVPEEHASVSDAESKASTVQSELVVAVRKVIRIVESFAQATGSDCSHSSSGQPDSQTSEISLHLEWKSLSLDNTLRNLVHVSNRFLQGKYDIIDFVTELGTALDIILALKPFERTDHLGNLNSHQGVTSEKNPEQEEHQRVLDKFAGLTAALEQLQTEKAEIESHLAEANDQVEELKAQLFKNEQFVSDGRAHQQVGDSRDVDGRKEDEMIEEELLVLSSTNPALRAASGELTKLHDKVAALETELHGERQRHESVVAKLTDLQEQVRRGGHAVSSELSVMSHGGDFSSHSTSEEDEDIKCQKQLSSRDGLTQEQEEREIAAAALAECQRTILALGKQLKGMGAVPQSREQPAEPSPGNSSTDSATSIQKMTENMEFLRWQTEVLASPINVHNHTPSALRGRGSPWTASPGPCRANRSPSPSGHRGSNGSGLDQQDDSSFYVRAESGRESLGDNGNDNRNIEENNGNRHEFLQRPPSPTTSDFSGQGSVASIPGSPARSPSPAVLRSLQTRANGVVKGINGEALLDENSGEKPRNSSSFSRFYSRSGSASSASSL